MLLVAGYWSLVNERQGASDQRPVSINTALNPLSIVNLEF